MAIINKQVLGVVGAAITWNAASGGGDLINQPGRAIVGIKNTSGASITATFVTPGTLPNGDAYPDHTVSVPATTGERWLVLGEEYTDANSQCTVTWSSATGVTFCVLSA